MPHAIPLHEFDAEMASTRRLLERVPSDKGLWKPHPKSMPLPHLAQLVATMPAWIPMTLEQPFHDLAEGEGYSNEPTDLLQAFDASVKSARESLSRNDSDATLREPWSLKSGEHTLMTLPKGEAVLQHLMHLSHHRGQLTVYLRMLDVPIPEIYGPTADTKAEGGQPKQ